MTKEESIQDTLDVIRRALEDDEILNKEDNVLILNKKVNSDGTIDMINDNDIKTDDIKKILDERISKIFEEHFDKWLEKKLPYYIKKYLDKK